MLFVPLRDISLHDLSRLFKEEADHWDQQLAWDALPTQKLLKQYIALKSLPGYVIQDHDGNPTGYSYFVIDKEVGFLGGLYILDSAASEDAYARLLDRTVKAITRSGIVRRIECQVFPFNMSLRTMFEERGFESTPRCFMSLELLGAPLTRPILERSFELISWKPSLQSSVAEVFQDSYIGSADFDLCVDYQSRQGCFRFLRNLINNPACGSFDPNGSRIVLNSQGQVVAAMVASLIRSDTGMIPQISVKRAFQGSGLGTAMIRSLLLEARKRGLKRVTLSVSKSNEEAFRLYKKLGFTVRKDFHAFIWKR